MVGGPAPGPKRANDIYSKGSTQNKEGPNPGCNINSTSANIGVKEEGKSNDPEEFSPTKLTTNSVTDIVQGTGVNSYKQIKQITRDVCGFAKDAAQKLVLILRIISFMPTEKILRERSWLTPATEIYNDSRGKIHNKPSLKLLFTEYDMEWIMAMIFYSERADTKPLLYFSAMVGAIFGSIHCVAWNFDFPSQVEQIMWRIASLTLVGVCLSIVVGVQIRNWSQTHWNAAEGGSLTQSLWGLLYLRRNISFIPTIIYPIARLTLLILALLSLRHLPDSALRTVTWTKFIPHI